MGNMLDYRSNEALGVDINGCDINYLGDWKEQEYQWNRKEYQAHGKITPGRMYYENSFKCWFTCFKILFTCDPEWWVENDRWKYHQYWIPRLLVQYPYCRKAFLIEGGVKGKG